MNKKVIIQFLLFFIISLFISLFVFEYLIKPKLGASNKQEQILSSDLKDKKIVELAKKNRAMTVQVDALKTKAAAAANAALKFKQEL